LRESGVFERTVAAGENGSFTWRERAGDESLIEHVHRALGDTSELPLPYLSEVRPMLAPWLASVAGYLEQGAALFIDYGYARARYYSPERQAGTLRCHYRHRAHDNPLILPGLQDITAWVDFDALADAAVAAGFVADEPVGQARFLIEHGLDEVFREAYANGADETVRYRLAQEVKRLTLSGEMGDTFQVAILRPLPQNQTVLAP
jgi:SAM-dependent MidA family methyltransferase